ncbi:MAG: type II toxin-antitoxin system CcdA family antitoxin [Conexivisphaerales archaeon]
MSEIITVRIDRETKKKIKKYKIKVSRVVRSALRAEIRKKERQELKEKVNAAKEILSKVKQ